MRANSVAADGLYANQYEAGLHWNGAVCGVRIRTGELRSATTTRRARRAAEIHGQRAHGAPTERLDHERRQRLQPALLDAEANRSQQRRHVEARVAHALERLRRR